MSLRAAIIGSGNIGTDLLVKAVRSPLVEPTLFVGRNLGSDGMAKAISLGVPVSDRSIDALIDGRDRYDLVFDATSARDARRHWAVLDALGKTVVDMTPAKVGELCVPAVNLGTVPAHRNINMVTCGGQASLPLAQLVGATHDEVAYVEVVSSIASRSAGPATRANLDEYIETTETAIRRFSGAREAKAILILNPAEPCVHMQTTVFAQVAEPRLEELSRAVDEMVAEVQRYVPGYQLVVPPLHEHGRVAMTVRVEGLGDWLPSYAGNLDIVNCAAIAVAEELARAKVAGTIPTGAACPGDAAGMVE